MALKYLDREKTAEVWVQARLDGTAELPRTPDPELLTPGEREQTAGDVIPVGGGVLALYHHPRLYDAGTGDLEAAAPQVGPDQARCQRVSR